MASIPWSGAQLLLRRPALPRRTPSTPRPTGARGTVSHCTQPRRNPTSGVRRNVSRRAPVPAALWAYRRLWLRAQGGRPDLRAPVRGRAAHPTFPTEPRCSGDPVTFERAVPPVHRLLDLVLFPRRTRRQARLLASLADQTRPAARPPAAAAGGGGSRPPARRGGNAGTHLYYGASVVRPSISPGLVRDRRFAVRTRRGCDPTEVRAFLHLVADELTAVRAELAATRDENVRIKQALRDWQSQQFQARPVD